jgi:putative transposase
LVEETKTNSSVRIKQEGSMLGDFHWQNGYGAFSVSPSNVEQVKTYIANQEEHHRKMTFQEEYRKMLDRHGIEYDERYAWD